MLLLLSACEPEDSAKPDDSDSSAGETDSETTPTGTDVDEDRDGSPAAEDCDDNDYRVHPGAAEACDGLDNDCDEAIDEDFDTDGDGHFADCGDDCDDADAAVYAGAAETPYDGLDQDCDGEDLVDVDGDGWAGEPAGGEDCDDEDATVNPYGTEVAFDGIDQDCDGLDDLDGDDDGWDAADAGGEDCDDADPAVHPGGADVYNDGVDGDCDGRDGSPGALADQVTIDGESGWTDLLGYGVAACDLDEDGFDDVVISAPFANGYTGRVGIFYGKDVASWSGGLELAGADSLIESTSLFLGFGLACADVDGDGHQDLVVGRGDIHFSTYNSDFGLVIFYGDGAAWPALLDETDAGAELSYALEATRGESNVFASLFWALDLDGDGASEVAFYPVRDEGYANGDDLVHVLPGARYEVDGEADAQDGAWTAATRNPASLRWLSSGGDPDGDGVPAVLVGEPITYDYDTASTDTAIPVPGAFSAGDATEGALSTGSLDIAGAEDLYFGWAAAVADVDGDGAEDLVVSGVGGEVMGEWPGYVYAWSGYGDIPEASPSVGEQDWEAYGEYPAGYLGWSLATAGDPSGDGAAELYVSEPAGGDEGEGRIYLLSGALLPGAGSVSDAAWLAWEGEDPNGSTGFDLATGDFDGDGLVDALVAAYAYPTADDSGADVYTGRAYVILSSAW